jgi:hypothetical protein
MKYKFLLILFFCQSYQSKAQLTVLPVFGDKPIAEETWFVSKNGDSIQFDNIRFYLSNIRFETIDNHIIKDSETAHLVDIFEPNSLKIAFQKVDFTRLKTVHFSIGIDSVTNVSGALSGDLDPQRGMYWAWQSGYVNLKIEGRSPQSKTRKNGFQYHIGGYLSPFYALKNVRLPVKVEGFNVGNAPISDIINPKYTEGVVLRIDVSKFFENISIATQNSIMMPCKEAMQLADYSVSMFSIQKNEK